MGKRSPASGNEGEVLTEKKIKTKQPDQFRVVLLNDDYTTMDFVVSILESVFGKSPAEAVAVMLAVHKKGSGVAGIYPEEVAEAKIAKVHNRARQEGYPLKCIMEPA